MSTTARRGGGEGSRRIYSWLGRHAAAVDAVLAVAGAALVGALYLTAATGPMGWGTTAAQVALVLPIAWRRSRPFLAACVMTVPCLVQLVFELPLGPGQLAVLVIIGANAARSPRWAARAVLLAGLVGIVLLALRYTNARDVTAGAVPIVFVLVAGWSLVGSSWLIGDVARSRRLERETLADLALRVERERANDRALAVAEERRHVARELHDIVAHSLAVVVTQADGARYAAAGTPGPAVPALDAIAATAREALDDMRGLLGVLRDGGAASAGPAEDLGSLPSVVAAVRSSGLDVQMRTEGEPRSLPAGMQLVLVRIVQEALTNVLKHAGARATADVVLAWDADGVTVSVLDTGVGPGPDGGRGHGLVGMAERVAVYDGSLEFVAREGGGARLSATLLYRGGLDG